MYTLCFADVTNVSNQRPVFPCRSLNVVSYGSNCVVQALLFLLQGAYNSKNLGVLCKMKIKQNAMICIGKSHEPIF